MPASSEVYFEGNNLDLKTNTRMGNLMAANEHHIPFYSVSKPNISQFYNTDKEKSQHLVRSKFENTEPMKKSDPISSRKSRYTMQYSSQMQLNESPATASNKHIISNARVAETVKSLIDQPIYCGGVDLNDNEDVRGCRKLDKNVCHKFIDLLLSSNLFYLVSS